MNAFEAFEKRKDELALRLAAAGNAQQAAEAASMTLEMIAADLAQDEQDEMLRQRQQAVLALAKRAPSFVRPARAEGELIVARKETKAPAKGVKIGLREAGALLLAALAVAEIVDGSLMFALLQAAGAALLYVGTLGKGSAAREEYRAQGVLAMDAQEMIRTMGELCRAADICVSDLQLIERERGAARLHGTADEAMLDLLVSLMEAKATGRGEVALRSLDQAETYLRMLGVEAAFFSRENAHMFDVLPTLSGERTIRPALIRDGKLIRRGVAACAAAQSAAR